MSCSKAKTAKTAKSIAKVAEWISREEIYTGHQVHHASLCRKQILTMWTAMKKTRHETNNGGSIFSLASFVDHSFFVSFFEARLRYAT